MDPLKIFKFLKENEIQQLAFEVMLNFHKKIKIFRNPYLSEISLTLSVYDNPIILLSELDLQPIGDDEECFKEFNSLAKLLQQRMLSVKLPYPLTFNFGEKSSFVIYCIIRKMKPKIVVESGVANGVSTFFILNAIIKNGVGKLYSIDINENVGALLSDYERKIWNLIIVKPKRKCLDKTIKKIIMENNMYIDIFLHDSNHTYRWQKFEYHFVFPYIAKNGFLISDDIDYSYAFLDFIKEKKCKAYGIIDNYKILGIINKRKCNA